MEPAAIAQLDTTFVSHPILDEGQCYAVVGAIIKGQKKAYGKALGERRKIKNGAAVPKKKESNLETGREEVNDEVDGSEADGEEDEEIAINPAKENPEIR